MAHLDNCRDCKSMSIFSTTTSSLRSSTRFLHRVNSFLALNRPKSAMRQSVDCEWLGRITIGAWMVTSRAILVPCVSILSNWKRKEYLWDKINSRNYRKETYFRNEKLSCLHKEKIPLNNTEEHFKFICQFKEKRIFDTYLWHMLFKVMGSFSCLRKIYFSAPALW